MRPSLSGSLSSLLPLGVILLLELGVCVGIYWHALAPALLLFAIGGLFTSLAFWLLLQWWHRAFRAWARFGLCLLLGFATYQVVVVLFVVTAELTHPTKNSHVGIGGWVAIGLLAANLVLFRIWIAIGSVTYGLLRVCLRDEARGGMPVGTLTDTGDVA